MRELRVGLVLYGGVALAVYINGIVTEIWHALRASQALRGSEKPSGTAGVYFDLLKQLEASEGTVGLRIVVDAVAGTSAGGVNGAVLAKAIVDGGDASVLNAVWIDQADISKLATTPPRSPWLLRTILWTLCRIRRVGELRKRIEDLPGLTWKWVLDTAYTMVTSKDGAFTPLNGSYFTRMIAAAYRNMGRAGNGAALLPERGTFDLAMTRTDIHGWPRHLPLSKAFHPASLYERTHAHVMLFRRRSGGEKLADDFGLTYACRSTAGFPGAFPPIVYTDIKQDYRAECPNDLVPEQRVFARRHLREHDLAAFPTGDAWMIDGGVLDNKPFTYVARAIEDKPADHEVYRVVAYIEPDPEGPVQPSSDGRPSALAMLKHLYSLSRHEPIYGDLRELYARNEKVERMRDIREANRPDAVAAAHEAGAAAGLRWPPATAELDRWRKETNQAVALKRGSGYAGYIALRARRAASIVAAAICEALEYPYDTRHAYFVRRLVRDWLAKKGALNAPTYAVDTGYKMSWAQEELLGAFDIPFRLRRIRALVQVVNRAYGAAGQERRQLDDCKRALADIAFGYEAALRDSAGVREGVFGALGAGDGDALDRTIGELASDLDAAIERYNDALSETYSSLIGRFRTSANEQSGRIADAIARLPADTRDNAAIELAAFPFVDLAVFPMMDAADVRDLIIVETMRISPHDATFLSDDPHRLKSRGLGSFAGFLDRKAREHDVLWGRLDGAERLIELIVAAATAGGPRGADLDRLRKEFTRNAMQIVLEEEEARPGSTIADLIRPLRDKLKNL